MKVVFEKTETSISNTKRKKKMLRKDVDRLLKDVICADIHNIVFFNSLSYASDSICDNSVDSVVTVVNTDTVFQIESLNVEKE